MEFWAEFWGAFTAFIFFLIAWLLTGPLPKWIKNRKEKKKLKQTYIELYQTFSDTDNLGKNVLFLMIIIETKIGVQEFQKKMNMLLDIYFNPERKTDWQNISGRIRIPSKKNQNENNLMIDPNMDEIIHKEAQISYSVNLNKKSYKYVDIKKSDFKRIKILSEQWMVIILFGNIIIVRKSDLKKFNYKEPKKNKDILSEFLKFIVSRYKEVKIIKNEKELKPKEKITNECFLNKFYKYIKKKR